MGHAALRPGPVGRGQIETFESASPGPTGLVCARCGYGLYPGNRVWTRQAGSFEGFANPPAALLRRVHERAGDATNLDFEQTSAGKTISETLSFKSAKDLWPILLEELKAAGARGGITKEESTKQWEGRLGDLELIASVSRGEAGSRLDATLRPPLAEGEIERAFQKMLQPR